MKKQSVVIIGAGLSGLAAAAFLSKAGFQTKIFERTAHIGGRCRSILLGNERFGTYFFDVGPIFSGLNIVKLIKERLKEKIAFKTAPVKIHIFSKGRCSITIPPSFSELRKTGLSIFETISLSYRLWRQKQFDAYSYMSSHHDIACFLTKNQFMRNIFNMRAGLFHGCLPDDMPGYTFNPKGYGRPFYPLGGMQSIPDTLLNIIKKYDGQIYTTAPVDKILIKNNKAIGVLVHGKSVRADFIISSVSIVQTVLKLCKDTKFNSIFLNQIKSYKQGLQASMVFMIVDKAKINVEHGNVLYVYLPPYDLNKTMHQLFKGIYPDEPPFGVFLTRGNEAFRPATLLFYTPKGETNKQCLIQEAERLVEKAALFIPKFTSSILWKKTVTSLDYPHEIGFKSCVLPVAESKGYKKMPFKLPVKNLYNVGSSVLPAGGGTVQAVKSGLQCAEFIYSSAEKSF